MNNDVITRSADTGKSGVIDFRLDRERERRALRVGILDAAGRVLAAEGPAGLSMRRIAKEVNASTQVLYTMFGGKDGLANELVVEGFLRLTAAHRAVPTSLDPVAYLAALNAAYVDNALANANYYRVMFLDAIPGFRPAADVVAQGWATFDPVLEAIRACARGGLFPPELVDSPHDAGLALWAAVHGVACLFLAGHLPGDGESEARRLAALTVDRIITSFRLPAGSPSRANETRMS